MNFARFKLNKANLQKQFSGFNVIGHSKVTPNSARSLKRIVYWMGKF